MRSDGDALLLGVGRHGGVAFISVLDPDIARTESGIGVGAGVQELIGALGALRAPANQGRDRRIITFTALPDTRFIVASGKVVAAVVMPADEEVVAAPAQEETSCKAPALASRKEEFLALLKGPRFSKEWSAPLSAQFACVTGDAGGALLRRGDSIGWAVADATTGELRVQASVKVPGLSFATILETGETHPEIYSVSERRSDVLREVVVTRYALVGGRLVNKWSRVAYSLGAKTASWIGATLKTADFLIEISGRDGAVELGGFYLERSHGAPRLVVPVDRVELPIGREPPPEADPGKTPVDAGSAPSTGSKHRDASRP